MAISLRPSMSGRRLSVSALTIRNGLDFKRRAAELVVLKDEI